MKPGHKETEIGVLPDNWNTTVFSKCFTILKNNTLSRAELSYDIKGISNIHYGDVLIKYGNTLDCSLIAFPVIKDSKKVADTPILNNGDLIIADTAEDESVGKATEIINTGNKTIVSGLHTIPCRPINGSAFHTGWLGYYINSKLYHDQLIPLITGIKVSSISKSSLSNTIVVIPPLAEQQRIAEALSDVDNMISSLEKLIEKKKAIKQGMMEQLLTGKMPLLGFEGELHGNWTKTSIGMLLKERIVSIQTGPFGTVLKAGEYSDHGIPVISVREIREGYIRIFDDTPTISLQVYNRLNQYILEPYDLVFARKGSIDRSAIIPKDGQKYFLGSDGIRLRFNNEILSQFMLYLFQSVEIKQFLSDNSYGTTMAGLNETTIKMIPVYYPTNHSIRNKIVEIITDIAKEIEKIEEKLIKQRELKASILSQVLSGKIRIK